MLLLLLLLLFYYYYYYNCYCCCCCCCCCCCYIMGPLIKKQRDPWDPFLKFLPKTMVKFTCMCTLARPGENSQHNFANASFFEIDFPILLMPTFSSFGTRHTESRLHVCSHLWPFDLESSFIIIQLLVWQLVTACWYSQWRAGLETQVMRRSTMRVPF